MLSVNLSIEQIKTDLPLPQIRIIQDPDIAKGETLYSSNTVYHVMSFIKKADREMMYALHLDAGHRIVAMELISVGSLTMTMTNPREVFKGAILNNSHAIILVHNHPSGNTTPSKDDLDTTVKCMDAGKLLGIEVLDHLIIGTEGYTSIRKQIENTNRKLAKRDNDKKKQVLDVTDILIDINETIRRQDNLSRADIKKLSRRLRKAIYKLFLNQGVAKCALRECYRMVAEDLKKI